MIMSKGQKLGLAWCAVTISTALLLYSIIGTLIHFKLI